MKCRGCGSQRLAEVFSLPPQNMVDYLDSKQAVGQKYPLNLLECQDCSLVQLDYTFPRDKLYRHYYYHSGTSEQQRAWLKNVVDDTVKRVGARKGMWVDIGSNDATLLKMIPEGWIRMGFEPAGNFEKDYSAGMVLIQNFFNAKDYQTLTPISKKKADVITCCACFYDVDNPHIFLDDVRQILAPDGLFVVQMNYLPTMLIQNSYDNISHEHVAYYSLKSLEALLAAHNLQAVAVELNEVNGGSFRVYIRHAPDEPEMSILNLRSYERTALTPSAWREFKNRVEETKMILTEFLIQAKKQKKTVWVYGASNRGGTILQYCGIGPDLVQACADRNPQKHGRKTITRIPIRSETEMRQVHPNFLLTLPYFYIQQFLVRELEYLDSGGTMIVPLPTPRLITKHGKEIRSELLK